MGERNPGSLNDVVKAIGEKQPNSIKEVVKVLNDLIVRLDAFATDIKSDVEKVKSSNDEIYTELVGIRSSLTFLNADVEQLKKDVGGFRRELSEVKVQCTQNQRENQQLSKELCDVKREVVELKQYSRNMNLEIKGLPILPNENLQKAVGEIATCLGAEISEGDIDVVHRVQSKDKGKPNVVVKFSSRTVRDKFLCAARKTKLNTSLLGFEANDPLYVNEHLCVENKILLSKARQERRDKNWKFVWVRQGKIFMRKCENSPVLHVTCEGDLARVV